MHVTALQYPRWDVWKRLQLQVNLGVRVVLEVCDVFATSCSFALLLKQTRECSKPNARSVNVRCFGGWR